MARFPNPCLVCGADDEHDERMRDTLEAAARYPVATVCPHPEQPGHGTGCCCAGISQEANERRHAEISASPPPLTASAIRTLLRECVTVVKPGEVLVLRCPEGWLPSQVAAMQDVAAWWLEANAPDIRVMVVPHLDMAVMQS